MAAVRKTFFVSFSFLEIASKQIFLFILFFYKIRFSRNKRRRSVDVALFLCFILLAAAAIEPPLTAEEK
jgi:hypothetical protein